MLHVVVEGPAGRTEFDHQSGPLEFGRGPKRDCARRVLDDSYVSANQLRVEERPGNKVRVENLSTRVPVKFSGTTLDAGQSCDASLKLEVRVGQTTIILEAPERDDPIDASLMKSVERPVFTGGATAAPQTLASLGDAPGADQLARWFEALLAVHRSAADSPEFYAETARAVVERIGLDCGLVLTRRDDSWEVAARFGDLPGRSAGYSRSILASVVQDRQTYFRTLPTTSPTSSQIGGSAVVAAPILSTDGRDVVGVIYGTRTPRPRGAEATIRNLEAQLVQVLAAAVGAALSRLASEDRAGKLKHQFEQFFSPELARQLERNPHLLDGEGRDVTVLFADIRGFSRISEQLPAKETCELVRDVMERMTVRIREHQGVVVDYIGDAILALWNAPEDQPDHARLACRAALAMRSELPALNDRWAAKLKGATLNLGVGLNTGEALVGNTGSQSRFKYGPLGHTVNLASRVEGATKHLGVGILITGETFAALGPAHPFAVRRLGQFEVAGIHQPATLYELSAAAVDPDFDGRRASYEAGLEHFESRRFAECCRTLYPLLSAQSGRYDRPTLMLVGLAVDHLKHPEADPDRPFRPVFKLDGK